MLKPRHGGQFGDKKTTPWGHNTVGELTTAHELIAAKTITNIAIDSKDPITNVANDSKDTVTNIAIDSEDPITNDAMDSINLRIGDNLLATENDILGTKFTGDKNDVLGTKTTYWGHDLVGTKTTYWGHDVLGTFCRQCYMHERDRMAHLSPS